MALAQVGSARSGGRVILALEDRLLRESLAMALAQEGFRIAEFASADAALSHIEAGALVDALIVNDRAVEGEESPRARLRAARCAGPVFVVSGRGDARDSLEAWGAVGVVDPAQPLQNLRRHLTKAIRAGVLLGETGRLEPGRSQDPLVFDAEGTRVSWKDSYLDLSPAERALLSGLVAAPNPGLTYQRARTILSGLEGRQSDQSPERVKSLVRRLRKKFREVDPDFDRIVFVPGCGYGWRGGEEPPRRTSR
ncbi:MAG: winged helix-turn-helix domain-containing protein [Kiloniellales bacterium]|nr:winged helix-turn-helix domain-containing protein [Kiloniellales bacterium]